jgi:putative MFS transporter
LIVSGVETKFVPAKVKEPLEAMIEGVTRASVEQLQQVPHGMNQRRTIILCAAGGFLDGYDLLIMGAALLLLVPEFHLTSGQTGLLASLPFLAMTLGALTAGRLCDIFGRRRVYLIDVLLFVVFALLQAVAQNVWQLAVVRFCVGFAIGVDMPTGSSMLAEFSPPKLRGALTAMLNTAWLLGGCAATIVGYTLYQTTGRSAWRWMFAAAAVPAAIIAIMRHGLPETPYWVREQSARVASGHRRGGFAALLGSEWRRPVAFFTTYWMLESFAAGPAFIYTALIFQKVIKLQGASALLLNAALLAVYTIASLILQFTLLDRWGRKPFAASACFVAATVAVATACLPGTGLALIIAFSLFSVAAQVAVLPFWPWSVEQLPTYLRATGQSVGSAGGKLGIFLGVLIFPPGAINTMGWRNYFFLVGGLFFCLVVLVLVFGRETAGTVLRE